MLRRFLPRKLCGISVAFAALSPTRGYVPTCYSAVRHSECKHPACDLHALGTPPAFVLSQDQTLHEKDGTGCLRQPPPEKATRDPNTSHHHDSVVKVQPWLLVRRTKNQGSARLRGIHLATGPRSRSAGRKLGSLDQRVVASTSRASETTAKNNLCSIPPTGHVVKKSEAVEARAKVYPCRTGATSATRGSIPRSPSPVKRFLIDFVLCSQL